MSIRAYVSVSLILMTSGPAVTHAAGSCPESAADRTYHPVTFRDLDAMKRFGVERDLLGTVAPNPLCYLNDIATRAAEKPVPGEGEAFRGVFTLAAHACAAGARAGDQATHERLCALPQTAALLQTESTDGERLVRELALQHALGNASAWVQTRPHRSAFMDARAPVAAAEIWSSRPIQAARALFTTFTCADVDPFTLNVCKVQKDVLALALKHVIEPVAAQAAFALDAIREGRREEDTHLRALLRVFDAAEEVSKHLRAGTTLPELMNSDVPKLFDRHLNEARVTEDRRAARAAAQATEELASLHELSAQLAAYRPTYPEIADAQFARARESDEMKAVEQGLTRRAYILVNILFNYLNGQLKLSSEITLD